MGRKCYQTLEAASREDRISGRGNLAFVTGAPSHGPRHSTWVARRTGFSDPTPSDPFALARTPPDRPGTELHFVADHGRQPVSYADRTLTCADCGVEFIHSAADQEFYAQKGFASDPKRCPSCRASRRQMRESSSGFDVREIGGPRGYERGDYRPQREYFAVICSKCGNAAQVPFKPRQDKPVYCSDCFRDVQGAAG